jgi:hypothetical protein
MHGDNKRALAAARAAGWRVRITRQGAVTYPPDGGRPIAIHNGRPPAGSVAHAIKQLRKAGLDV